MPLITTPGDPTANSYATNAEADAYFAMRVSMPKPWESMSEEEQDRALAWATTTLDASFASPHQIYTIGKDGMQYIQITPSWVGAPATPTQVLAWPRVGMRNNIGNPIDPAVIPVELKNATCELAGQLLINDTTLDNDVITSGISSVKAGSVSVSFKDSIMRHVFPDSVLMLMPGSWFTMGYMYLANTPGGGAHWAEFDVV